MRQATAARLRGVSPAAIRVTVWRQWQLASVDTQQLNSKAGRLVA